MTHSSSNGHQLTVLCQKYKKQQGLGSVELVLIAMVLLVMMHITLKTSESMVHYHQRVVEARNSAYKTELYMNGETTVIDDTLNYTDENVVQPLEDLIEQASPILDWFQINSQRYNVLVDLDQYIGRPVAGYSRHEADNDKFYDDMIELTWDNMNAYQVPDGDADLMMPHIKPLIDNIRDKKSSFTTGVGFSEYFSFAGAFDRTNHGILQRSYHAADFADFVAISDHEDLHRGYMDKMQALLPPNNSDRVLFQTVFPTNSPGPTLAALPLPPLPPLPGAGTVGITPGEPGGDTPIDQAYEAYQAAGGDLPFNYWWTSEAPNQFSVDELRTYARDNNWNRAGTLWPPYDGFEGNNRFPTQLRPGETIDRYGTNPDGNFFGDPSDGFTGRGLLPERNNPNEYQRYEVLRPFNVDAGRAAAWFDDPGGASQYESEMPLSQLIAEGYIREIP